MAQRYSKQPRAAVTRHLEREKQIANTIQSLMADPDNRRALRVTVKEMAFSIALQQQMDNRNMDEIDVAAKAGCTVQMIGDILRLKRSPDLKLLIGISEALNCAIVLWLGDTPIEVDPNGILKKAREEGRVNARG